MPRAGAQTTRIATADASFTVFEVLRYAVGTLPTNPGRAQCEPEVSRMVPPDDPWNAAPAARHDLHHAGAQETRVNGSARHTSRTAAALVALGLLAAACGQTTKQDVEPANFTMPEVLPEVEVVEEPEEPEEPEPVGTTPLTGTALYDEDELAVLAERPAVVVKIPNDPSARPHTGIEEADVVYEQETEGGTTRFAAVFHSRYPEVVGNVRSGRHVDVPLVAPYDGVMVYSGARASVQNSISAAGITRVTEGGPGFYRDGSRRAPHNLYVRLPQAAAARESPPAAPSPWRFDDAAPEGGREVTGRVGIPVSRSATAGWEYDEEAGVFRRFQNGSPHTVTGEGVIGAANVVALDVPVTGRDSHGAPVYALEGTGSALLLRDGRAFDIAWSKGSTHAALELVDGRDPAVLSPGPTWVVLTYGDALARISGLE